MKAAEKCKSGGRKVGKEAGRARTSSEKRPKHMKSGGRKKRWGHYEDKRSWREYNEKLVKRGEMYISLDFAESWGEELEDANDGKVGAPYRYPDSLIIFLGFAYIMLKDQLQRA